MDVSAAGAYGLAVDADAFLMLFVEQLKHQDPTQPMNPSEMMSQLAQMTSVQQLEQLNATFQKAFRAEQFTLAKDLIGSNVSYYANGRITTGRVDEAAIEQKVVGVRVEGRFVPLEDVRSILGPANAEPETSVSETTGI